jgi:hypothetical protein
MVTHAFGEKHALGNYFVQFLLSSFKCGGSLGSFSRRFANMIFAESSTGFLICRLHLFELQAQYLIWYFSISVFEAYPAASCRESSR